MTDSVLAHAPAFTLEEAVRLARDLFGVDGVATSLPSERDQNVRLDLADGSRRVLKIANAREDLAFLEVQHQAMRAAGRWSARPVASLAGGEIAVVEWGGARYGVRLVTWLDGVPLGTVRHRPEALLASLGRMVAEVDLGLQGLDHPALRRRFHWDLAEAPAVLAQGPRLPDGDPARTWVARIADLHAQEVAPRLSALPHQAIHDDANDYNVLVDVRPDPAARHTVVTGLLDWGDMVRSARVHDLAIAAAYAALGQDDPLAAAAAVVRGYHATLPLHDDEIAVLFPLVLARWGMSLCHAADQMAARPGDPYLAISQGPIRAALPRLLAVHPRLAHYVFRDACGLPPVPHAAAVVRALTAVRDVAPVASLDGDPRRVRPLDMSAGSALVRSNPAENGPVPLTLRLLRALGAGDPATALATGAWPAMGAGGYLEPRVIYTSPAFQGERPLAETRTVHLGIDLTLPAGTPVHAPLDGEVHGLEDAAAPLDYGPVIVLRHDVGGETCYTLYGHLARASLDGLAPGTRVAKGQRIGWIGDPSVNGGWWPHLHFQLITDMLDVPCNVNGSALPSHVAVWASLCPDPNLLLRLPPEALPAPRPTAETLRASRRAHTGGNVSLSYRRPIHAVRGWKQHLYDAQGRRYLDAYNNVPHVGHAHPRVVAAVADQLAVLNTNTRYLQDVHEAYVEALLATFPAPLDVVFLTASGSEANELALRLARTATGARDVLVLDAAYHGHTVTAIDVSPYKHAGPGGTGAPAWVHATPIPDTYRGPHRGPDAGARYAAMVGEAVDRIQGNGGGLCAYLAETCPSVGGQILLPPGYLADVYQRVRAAGGLCIADEVQTGLGRIGTHFWAFEAHGVVPDVVVLGKPLGNGYPMGAVVTTRAIADAFDNGMEYFSTFGGSTVACAAGLATLQVTQEEALMAHAREVGDHLLAALRELPARHALVGDVRGSGLFVGVELVGDRERQTPAAAEASAVVERMRELGVLAGTDGPFHNVVKVRGPMPFDRADADLLAAVFDRALADVSA